MTILHDWLYLSNLLQLLLKLLDLSIDCRRLIDIAQNSYIFFVMMSHVVDQDLRLQLLMNSSIIVRIALTHILTAIVIDQLKCILSCESVRSLRSILILILLRDIGHERILVAAGVLLMIVHSILRVSSLHVR